MVEVDKEITFKYTKLAVKTVKCYGYYWIIQDLEATKTAYIQYGVTDAASYTVECLEVVHFLIMNEIFTKKANFCLAALTSAHTIEQFDLLNECCSVKMANRSDLTSTHSDFMH